jgi:hypothetical protein
MNAIDFVNKQRQEYDRLLDEAPDIPLKTIQEFNQTFPEKENKPDVCNGLNVIEEMSDSGSDTKVRHAITRWLKRTRGNKSFELSRGESV